MINFKEKQLQFWVGPMEQIRLKAFRWCIGFSLLLYMSFRFRYAREWLTNEGFHISAQNLPYFDLSLPLLPEYLVVWFGILFFTSILAFMMGWQLKWTSWIVLFGLVYVSAADQLTFFSPNKLLIVSVFICAMSTLGECFRRPGDHEGRSSSWPVRILQATIIIHLFTAGLAKVTLGGEWFVEPYVLWTQIQGTYRTDFAAFLLNVLPLKAWVVMQWNALLLELLFPFLMASKHLRRFGIIWGIIFQLIIAATMKHLIYFNLIIISYFILFLDKEILYKIKSYFIAGKKP